MRGRVCGALWRCACHACHHAHTRTLNFSVSLRVCLCVPRAALCVAVCVCVRVCGRVRCVCVWRSWHEHMCDCTTPRHAAPVLPTVSWHSTASYLDISAVRVSKWAVMFVCVTQIAGPACVPCPVVVTMARTRSPLACLCRLVDPRSTLSASMRPSTGCWTSSAESGCVFVSDCLTAQVSS